jgi:membrane-bound inhibitor of C-type lysozyme
MRRHVVPFIAGFLLVACQSGPTQEEIEAASQSVDCAHDNERFIIRFTEGEARILMPDGSRTILYQVQVASGVRYLSSGMELRGRGMEFDLTRHDQPTRLTCKAYELPKKN